MLEWVDNWTEKKLVPYESQGLLFNNELQWGRALLWIPSIMHMIDSRMLGLQKKERYAVLNRS